MNLWGAPLPVERTQHDSRKPQSGQTKRFSMCMNVEDEGSERLSVFSAAAGSLVPHHSFMTPPLLACAVSLRSTTSLPCAPDHDVAHRPHLGTQAIPQCTLTHSNSQVTIGEA